MDADTKKLVDELDTAAKKAFSSAPQLIPDSLFYIAARKIEEQAAEIDRLLETTCLSDHRGDCICTPRN